MSQKTYNFGISLFASPHDPQPHAADPEAASTSVPERCVAYFRTNAITIRSAKRIDAAMYAHSGSIDTDPSNLGQVVPVIS